VKVLDVSASGETSGSGAAVATCSGAEVSANSSSLDIHGSKKPPVSLAGTVILFLPYLAETINQK
jgi:hypothetical protein